MKDVALTEEKRKVLVPFCAISGDDTSVQVRVELPGVNKKDVDVKIDGDQLVVQGKVPDYPPEGVYLIKERRNGDFYRSFTIDQTIDREKIDASYDQGVMTITLHVKEAAKPRRIEIA